MILKLHINVFLSDASQTAWNKKTNAPKCISHSLLLHVQSLKPLDPLRKQSQVDQGGAGGACAAQGRAGRCGSGQGRRPSISCRKRIRGLHSLHSCLPSPKQFTKYSFAITNKRIPMQTGREHDSRLKTLLSSVYVRFITRTKQFFAPGHQLVDRHFFL